MNDTYKKICIILASSSLLTGHECSATEPITLTNPLIHVLDGKPWGFGMQTIKDMLHFYGRLNRFQHGHKSSRSETIEGQFQFKDTFITLDEVARHEKTILEHYQNLYTELDNRFIDLASFHKEKTELEKKYAQEHKIKDAPNEYACPKRLKLEISELKLKHIKDKIGYETALKELDKNFKEEIAPFQTILIQAADQLLVFVEPFLDNIRAIKGFLVAIINEWQDAHLRHDSALNQWKNAPDGKELEEFHKDITTVNQLIIFCDDLRSLIRDIIHSCPLGLAQYKEMQNKQP